MLTLALENHRIAAAEAVNALLQVTDHKDVLVIPRNKREQRVLQAVRILKLVYKYLLIPVTVFAAYVFVFLKQPVREMLNIRKRLAALSFLLLLKERVKFFYKPNYVADSLLHLRRVDVFVVCLTRHLRQIVAADCTEAAPYRVHTVKLHRP